MKNGVHEGERKLNFQAIYDAAVRMMLELEIACGLELWYQKQAASRLPVLNGYAA